MALYQGWTVEVPEVGGTTLGHSALGFGRGWCYNGVGRRRVRLMAHMRGQMLKQQLKSYALWRRSSQCLATSVLPTLQLPDAIRLMAMLTGARNEQDLYTKEQRNAFYYKRKSSHQ